MIALKCLRLYKKETGTFTCLPIRDLLTNTSEMTSETKEPWTFAAAELLTTVMNKQTNRKQAAPEGTNSGDGASTSERPLRTYDVLDVFIVQALQHIVRKLEQQESTLERLERHLKRAISDFAPPDQDTLTAIRNLDKAISGWKQQIVAAANPSKETTHVREN